MCGKQSLPFKENFENYNRTGYYAVDALTPPDRYIYGDHHIPPCWTPLSMTMRNDLYPQFYVVDNANNSGARYAVGHGSGKAFVMRQSNNANAYLVLPQMDAPIDSLYIDFYHRNYNEWSPGWLYLGYLDEGGTFHEVQIVPNCFDHKFFTYDFAANPNAGNFPPNSRIAFRFQAINNNNAPNFPVMIDNIVVNRSTDCKRVTNAAVSVITSDAATLSWAAQGNASAYKVEYGPAGFAEGTGSTATTTNLTYQITGLTANKEYDFYITTQCILATGTRTTSTTLAPSTYLHARTACNTSQPYRQNFDAFGNDYVSDYYNATNVCPDREVKKVECWFFPDTSDYYAADV